MPVNRRKFVILLLKIHAMELEYKDHLSPMLKGDFKNYLIDIDGTITDDVPNEEPERMVDCEPYPDALETINRWYD